MREETEILREFEARFQEPEREAIVRHLLAGALTELPCTACGQTAFTFERGSLAAWFECSACHRRTVAGFEDGKLVVFSEDRLARILQHARSRRWYCPDHAGVAATASRVELDAQRPVLVTVHFNCSRRRGLGKKRVHNGAIATNLVALEAQMLAEG